MSVSLSKTDLNSRDELNASKDTAGKYLAGMALQVYAQAYDNPIPGYGTKTVGNLRLFEATPVTEFNLTEFNEGAYDKAVLESRKANDISAVLYPNDATEYGKELRLKQQIFFVSASIQARRTSCRQTHMIIVQPARTHSSYPHHALCTPWYNAN